MKFFVVCSVSSLPPLCIFLASCVEFITRILSLIREYDQTSGQKCTQTSLTKRSLEILKIQIDLQLRNLYSSDN